MYPPPADNSHIIRHNLVSVKIEVPLLLICIAFIDNLLAVFVVVWWIGIINIPMLANFLEGRSCLVCACHLRQRVAVFLVVTLDELGSYIGRTVTNESKWTQCPWLTHLQMTSSTSSTLSAGQCFVKCPIFFLGLRTELRYYNQYRTHCKGNVTDTVFCCI